MILRYRRGESRASGSRQLEEHDTWRKDIFFALGVPGVTRGSGIFCGRFGERPRAGVLGTRSRTAFWGTRFCGEKDTRVGKHVLTRALWRTSQMIEKMAAMAALWAAADAAREQRG